MRKELYFRHGRAAEYPDFGCTPELRKKRFKHGTGLGQDVPIVDGQRPSLVLHLHSREGREPVKLRGNVLLRLFPPVFC
jgi:hypothetical protein